MTLVVTSVVMDVASVAWGGKNQMCFPTPNIGSLESIYSSYVPCLFVIVYSMYCRFFIRCFRCVIVIPEVKFCDQTWHHTQHEFVALGAVNNLIQ